MPRSNRTHAADVLQTMHVLVAKSGLAPHYVDQLTLMGCYLAACAHDVEHAGLTNDYCECR